MKNRNYLIEHDDNLNDECNFQQTLVKNLVETFFETLQTECILNKLLSLAQDLCSNVYGWKILSMKNSTTFYMLVHE